jgi:hypothetical protein
MPNICNRCQRNCKSDDKVCCMDFKGVDDHSHKKEDRAYVDKIVRDALIKFTLGKR